MATRLRRTVSSLLCASFVFIFSLQGFSSSTSVECPQYFAQLFQRFDAHEGVPWLSPIWASARDGSRVTVVEPGATVRKLGEGKAGGSVFHVIPPGGKPSYSIKIYDGRSFLPREEGRNHDALAAGWLQKVIADNQIRGIRVVKTLDQLGVDTLKLEYVRGRTLKEIGDRLPESDYLKLQRKFLVQVQAIEAGIRKVSTITVSGRAIPVRLEKISIDSEMGSANLADLSAIFRYEPAPGQVETLYIRIKADNIVVTQDGELVIIDPL